MCTSFGAMTFGEVHADGEMCCFGRKSLFGAFLFDCRPSCMTRRQGVTFLVVTVKPQQSPEASICLTLEPGQVVGQECRPPRFFGWARLRLSACALRRHVEVTSSNVCVVQLGNLSELTQKRSRSSLPLRGGVAQTNRGPSNRPKVSLFGVLGITCCGHHASRHERIFAKQNELICTVALFEASSKV